MLSDIIIVMVSSVKRLQMKRVICQTDKFLLIYKLLSFLATDSKNSKAIFFTNYSTTDWQMCEVTSNFNDFHMLDLSTFAFINEKKRDIHSSCSPCKFNSPGTVKLQKEAKIRHAYFFWQHEWNIKSTMQCTTLYMSKKTQF